MNQSRPLSENGSRSSAPRRSAMMRASTTSATGSRMMPNSSPPNRATVSPGRTAFISRCPTAASSRSPTPWPRLSLMTLKPSRSSRMTAISVASPRWPARACRIRSVRSSRFGEAGGRVVERAALGGVDEPRVVEPDRGELGEVGQGVDLAPAPQPAGVARREAEDADDPPARRQRHGHHGAERFEREVRRAIGPGVVVVDRDGAPRCDDRAGQALVAGDAQPQEVGVEARPDAQHEAGAIGLEQVDEGVRRADERRRPVDDGLEQAVLVVTVEERDGRVVEGAQVRIGETAEADVVPIVAGRLDDVHRPVGDRDQLVVRAAVDREAGDAGADRDARAAGRRAALVDRPADPLGHVVGDQPVGPGQDGGELVAAVPVEAVAVARRTVHRAGDLDQECVAGRMTERVVVALEGVEVEHQDGERVAQLDRLAELPLEGAVVAQPGQRILLGPDPDLAVRFGVLERDRRLAGEQLGQLELVVGERGVRLAHPADVQRADRLARDRAAGRRSSTPARTASRGPGRNAGRGGPRWPGPPRRGR